jgi:hypothetical protein
MNTGGMVHITFTNVRPDDGDLFSGKNPPRLRGAVACRLLMPAGVANQLVRTLADVLIQSAQSSEPASNQTQPKSPVTNEKDENRSRPGPINFD